MKTCILADNQFITSEGIYTLLREMGVNTIIRAKTKDNLQKELILHPNALVILDYTLFDFVSMEQLLNVIIGAKKASWLLFSDELSKQFVRYILSSDPTISIVMKSDSEKEIKGALTSVINYMPYICDFAEQILSEEPIKTETATILTASEKMILKEIASGKTTKEIANEKNLSFHTVNSHRKNIYRKLEVNSANEATRYAIQAGLFDVSDYYI